jgi:DNA-binding response OmpR family regulator
VLTADNGTEAVLRSAQHPGTIDLLLSDVVMPDFGGTALADRIRAQRPGIKVLFMSGYTGDDMTRHGVEAATKMLVQKPFTTSELAKRIRAAIDQTE